MDLYGQVTANFHRWAQRGQGHLLSAYPVELEPPFVPFPGHRVKFDRAPDEGAKPTFVSRLADRMFKALQPPVEAAVVEELAGDEPEPTPADGDGDPLLTMRFLLPQEMSLKAEDMAVFLASVSGSTFPITLELVGLEGQSSLQMAVHADDFEAVAAQVESHFPEVIVQAADEDLAEAWGCPGDGLERVTVEFGLSRPFMWPLADSGKADLFVGLTGTLSSLVEAEAGVYQVTFTPMNAPWAEQAVAALIKPDGTPFFENTKELVKAAQQKLSQPLYGVVVRLAARAPELDRAWEIVRRMAAPLRLFSNQAGNALMPLPNGDYDDSEHAEDLLFRRSRRCGMILSSGELSGFIRFPTAAVGTPGFLRVDDSTREASPAESTRGGICLGINTHAGVPREVWLTPEQRVRHMHLVGASGSGKTTLMFNLIRQDIASGTGFALLDPHGDLVDRVLEMIPPERRDDVVLLDPGDEQFIVPFNVLSAHSDFEKTLLSSDLVAIFRAQSTSWGDQMNVVLGNAIRAFLESTEGGTLADLRRFLLDLAWRDQFLKTVTDPEVVFYWKRGFPQLGGNKSIGPILTRLETFLAPKPIRYMFSQRGNRLDFAAMMDQSKIFLAKLPQGQMGKENSHLLGSLLVAKLQQTAMSRQRMEAKLRRPFFVYADEFQNFICPSMAEILSGARKYGIGFILAHQDLRQLERDKEVASAVLSNAFTRVVFRVSDSDARVLAEGFAHFQADVLQNLPIGKAICRIERANNDFNLAVPWTAEPDATQAAGNRRKTIESSRVRVATPRNEVEAILLKQSNGEVIGENGRGKKEKPSSAMGGAPVFPSESAFEAQNAEANPVADLVNGGQPHSQDEEPELSGSLPNAGKGGHQHLLMQERIKAAAEAQGFRAVIEHPTGAGNESVDVALLRADLRVACEVSVTTTIDHEIGNARKCLSDNFDLVAMITGDERRRNQLATAVAGHFPANERSKIRCYSPDEFIAYLGTVPEPRLAPTAPPSKTVQGWTVKRKFLNLTPEERAAQTRIAFDLLSQEMKLVKLE